MAEKLNTIGGCLKEARRKKKVSLDDVYGKTRIHTSILEALEGDRPPEFLSRVYVKSFIRRYARYLGIEEDEIVKSFLIDPVREKQPLASPVAFERQRNFFNEALKEKFNLKSIDPEQMKKFARPVAALLAGIFIIYIIGFTGAKIVKGIKRFGARRAAAPAAVVDQTAAPLLKAGFVPIAANEKLVLELKTTQDVWMEVKSDGKIIFRHVRPGGSAEKWTAAKSIELWLGKAQSVEMTLNGQALKPAGKGVVKNITLTREGMKIK